MSDMSILPESLQARLKQDGYTVEDPEDPLPVTSAEKFIYDAQDSDDNGVVVLHAKRSDRSQEDNAWEWDYKRELEFFQLPTSRHKHIIRMLAYIEPAVDNSYGPCMVLERVEPLGFDLFELVKLYKNAQNRFMPLAQWTRYLLQLLDAVQHLHNNGVVHCDLKLDNVLVAADHEIKLIDFGMVRKVGEAKPAWRAPYMPPEFDILDASAKPSADLWMIGAMMLTTFTGYPVSPVWIGKDVVKQKGVLDAMRSWKWSVFVTDFVDEAITGLLQHDVDKRWTSDKLLAWAETAERPMERSASMKLPQIKPDESFVTHRDGHRGTCLGTHGMRFQKAKGLQTDRIIKAFGFQAGVASVGGQAPSELIGRFIGPGPHCQGGAEVLDFKQFLGATVLFIDRPGGVIAIPKCSDRIEDGDWVYIKLEEDSVPETDEQREFRSAAQEARKVGVEIFLEFDEFKFPDHCVGMTIGPKPQGCGLRNRFGIGLAFISRWDAELHRRRMIEVGMNTMIEAGDYGLVCRVPHRETGVSVSVLSDELLLPLLDVAEFWKTMADVDDYGKPLPKEEAAKKAEDEKNAREAAGAAPKAEEERLAREAEDAAKKAEEERTQLKKMKDSLISKLDSRRDSAEWDQLMQYILDENRAATPQCKLKKEVSRKMTFEPGSLGCEISEQDFRIENVHAGGQCQKQGLHEGAVVTHIDDVPFELDLLRQKSALGSYSLTFKTFEEQGSYESTASGSLIGLGQSEFQNVQTNEVANASTAAGSAFGSVQSKNQNLQINEVAARQSSRPPSATAALPDQLRKDKVMKAFSDSDVHGVGRISRHGLKSLMQELMPTDPKRLDSLFAAAGFLESEDVSYSAFIDFLWQPSS